MIIAISDNKYGGSVTNLAEIINEISTISAIDLYYESNFKQRDRLGLSQIGHPCKRYLWYKHNGYPEKMPEGRVLRLFQMGNLIEDQMVKDLMDTGFSITGQQKQVTFTFNNITLTGSIDGVISGLIESSADHLWECKSMGSKGFVKLLKHGYEAYNDQYKGQIHAYMLGLGLKNAFVTVYNKDTSELYQERIKLKKDWIIDKLQDVFSAISGPIPDRLCPRIDFWSAKWCDFYQECFK